MQAYSEHLFHNAKIQQNYSRKYIGLLFEINGMKYFACFLPSYRSVDTGRCGVSPLEGVADKQQSGEKRHCLQGRFAERLAWSEGKTFPSFCLWNCFILNFQIAFLKLHSDFCCSCHRYCLEINSREGCPFLCA